ncbi:hypothetical protein J3R30DRAFT_139811 [Lentinula aciculospora]|uniref:NAD(P)-binding protein n=1 Tax=Lentinula aciculospora TaxID=153920 RepID=A0A9W9AUG3_9AGAR|nr:hypothetical protein J3R30DRAFT_139811 [Lentinula aciculospora]
MSAIKPVLVVAGVRAGGTGAATAAAFARKGYSLALISRGSEDLKALEEELKAAGNEATAFPVSSYSASSISAIFQSIHTRYPSPDYTIRAALYNASHSIRKPFLETSLADFRAAQETIVEGSFTFSQEVIRAFKENDVDSVTGKRGMLIFTGSTTSIRGNTTTSAAAPAKWGMRALSQSLAKEFGAWNIHVAHAIIDGVINTPFSRSRFSDRSNWVENEDIRLNAEDIAKAYVYLAEQPRSAWTWELDLRPALEKW